MQLPRRRFLGSVAVAAGLLRNSAESYGAPRPPVAWLTEVQQPPEKLPDKAPRLAPLLADAQGRAIATADAWQTRRTELRRSWLEFLGPPPAERRGPPVFEVLSEDRPEGLVRQLVRYEVEPGVPTEAYLIFPAPDAKGGTPAAKRPGVVVLHETVSHSIRQPAGVEGAPEKAFGLKLARRGCVTLSPRNFLWPTNHKIAAREETARFLQRHPRTTGMRKMLHDAQVALDLLVSLPSVDPERLGTVGHSLGAKEVVYLAAFDERIRVTVSSEGGIGTTFSNWHDLWYLGPAIKEPTFAREHHELLALIAPRPFLLLGGDSADGAASWPFIDAVLPVYRLLGATQPPVGLLNHQRGHSVPPIAEQRIDEWFATYL